MIAELAVVIVGFLLYPLERGTPPLLATLLAVGLLVGGAVATAFVLEPLGRIVGAPFERFFGATGLLGRANLGRDRARTGLSVAALTIALAAVVTLGTTATSARGTADRWVQSILPGGHAIRLPVPSSIDVLQPDDRSHGGHAWPPARSRVRRGGHGRERRRRGQRGGHRSVRVAGRRGVDHR